MVEKDKEYILNIEALGYEGEGIAKIEGYPVFIPGALIGEKVKVIITIHVDLQIKILSV